MNVVNFPIDGKSSDTFLNDPIEHMGD